MCGYPPPPTPNRQRQDMRGRIRKLENIVVGLINEKTDQQAPREHEEAADDTVNVDSFGQLRIGNTGHEKSYVGAGHWSTLLKEISEVKYTLDNDEPDNEPEAEEWDESRQRSNLSFGNARPTTRAALLDALPPRDEVDRLVAAWFKSGDPLLYLFHVPSFQTEYKHFWADSQSAPVMWIALLYATMALGVLYGPKHAHNGLEGARLQITQANSTPIDAYQMHAASALALADITRPQPYTIEVLTVYMQIEFLRSQENHVKLWFALAVLVRVALRMGYHRDPRHFAGMSPFQGEMRRRVWHFLHMMDSLMSFSIGLPSMLRCVESDTRLPRNLHDADIAPAMAELPPQRPPDETTSSTYVIAKSRICVVFDHAAEQSQHVVSPQYADLVALDARLSEAVDQIPPGMRVRPLDDCIADPSVLTMCRFNVDLLAQKTRIVLHRNYLTAGQSNAKYAGSRSACVEAAMRILQHEKVIFHACQPGGQLYDYWWYIVSVTSHDFLLAALVVSIELNYLRTAGLEPDRAAAMLALLSTTYQIWLSLPQRYSDSNRGAKIVREMLKQWSAPTAATGTARTAFGHDANVSADAPPASPPPPQGAGNAREAPSMWQAWSTDAEAPSFELAGLEQDIDWVGRPRRLPGTAY